MKKAVDTFEGRRFSLLESFIPRKNTTVDPEDNPDKPKFMKRMSSLLFGGKPQDVGKGPEVAAEDSVQQLPPVEKAPQPLVPMPIVQDSAVGASSDKSAHVERGGADEEEVDGSPLKIDRTMTRDEQMPGETVEEKEKRIATKRAKEAAAKLVEIEKIRSEAKRLQESAPKRDTSVIRSGYEGEYDAKGRRNGFGRYLYTDGTVYAGEWAEGKKSGKGKLRDPKGNEYVGMFSDNKMSGRGRYTYAIVSEGGDYSADGQTIFEGVWKDDQREGQGRFFFGTGDVLEVQYSKGKVQPSAKYYYVNGALYEGGFVDFKKSGTGKYTFVNGGDVYPIHNGHIGH